MASDCHIIGTFVKVGFGPDHINRGISLIKLRAIGDYLEYRKQKVNIKK